MKRRLFRISALAIFCFSIHGCQKTPAGPEDRNRTLLLTLDLARNDWHMGEQPWYRLQFTNSGKKSITVFDSFWRDQAFLGQNSDRRENTYFEVLGPDGIEVKPGFLMEWGSHGEFRFWVNDCEGVICHPNQLDGIAHDVGPGETFTATPSIVAPLRKSTGTGLLDARVPPGATPAEIDAYQKLWKIQERGLEATDRKPYQFGLGKQPRPIAGYRILEGYHFRKPGKYRIKAVFDNRSWLTPVSAEEELRVHKEKYRREPDPETRAEIIAKWKRMSPKDLAWYRRLRQDWEADLKRSPLGPSQDKYLIESNPVEFFVIP